MQSHSFIKKLFCINGFSADSEVPELVKSTGRYSNFPNYFLNPKAPLKFPGEISGLRNELRFTGQKKRILPGYWGKYVVFKQVKKIIIHRSGE